jgi:HK97 family phage portal protein
VSVLKRLGGVEKRAVTLESILGTTETNWNVTNWSGIPVTPRTALAHPAVYRCRQLICGKLSGFPWVASRTLRNGSIEILDPQPPVLVRPSGVVNWKTWRWQAVESLVFDGNAVGRIVKRDPDNLRIPTQIELYPMHCVQVRQDAEGRWRWKLDGEEVSTDEIWHVAMDPPAGHILGRSLLEVAANAVGIGIASQRYSANFYADGGHPSMILRNTKKAMAPGDSKEVKERVMAVLQARREPLVLGSDWEAKEWQASPADAQLIQVWARNSTDVANYFGVPPEYVAGATSSSMTYTNLGARRQDLVALCFEIWGDPIEAGLTESLQRTVSVDIDYRAFIAGDLATMSIIDERDIKNGIKTPDEVRKSRGMAPLPGGQGSKVKTTPAPAPKPAQPEPAPTTED